MGIIRDYLSHGHHHCDDLFVAAENVVADGDIDAGKLSFEAFRQEMEVHFSMEESVMFPAFEDITGMTAGPTAVMRAEHVQMREVFGQMQAAVAANNADEYLGLSETLLMIMQQHNFKEEQMLYGMADSVLGAEAESIIERMKTLEVSV